MAWQISFFKTILYSTLYASFLICMLLIFRKIFGKRLRPSSRMLLWYGVILLTISTMTLFKKGSFTKAYVSPSYRIPPFGIEFLRMGQIVSEGGMDIWQPTGEIFLQITNYFNFKSYSFKGNVVLQFIFVIWLIGIFLIALRYGIGYIRLLRKLRGYDEYRGEGVFSIVKEECLFQSVSVPKIKIVPQKYFREISAPCVVGFKRPMLIILKEQWELFDIHEKHAVVMHEISHIKHKDNFLNLSLIILYSIQWFNPLLYLAFKMLRQDLECLRDRQIMEALTSKERYSYASAIFKIAQTIKSKYCVSLHSGMLSSSGLGFRMELLRDKEDRTCLWEIVAVVFLIFLLLTMIFSRETIGLISERIISR